MIIIETLSAHQRSRWTKTVGERVMPESDLGGLESLWMNSRQSSLPGRGIRTGKARLMLRLRDLQRNVEDDLGSNHEVNLSWQGRFSL
jgi:hypothetical protein